jgi:hypothetical protein
MDYIKIAKIAYKTINLTFAVAKLVPLLTKHKDAQKVIDAHEEIQTAIDNVVKNSASE